MNEFEEGAGGAVERGQAPAEARDAEDGEGARAGAGRHKGAMAGARVLVVDDEQGVRTTLSAVLRDEGFEIETAASGEEALAILEERSFHAILLDVWLPGRDGLDTLRQLRRNGVDAAVVMISGHGSIETAVRATRMGAHDFVEKPLSLEKILLTLRNALRARKLEERNRLLREELRRDAQLIGESASIRALRERIEAAAPTAGGVLIWGEKGSGKELVARLLHARSPRAEEAFIEVACGAVPPEQAALDLLGHAGGPGAAATKGRLELAQEGTLFLADVDALPPDAQHALFRALETGRFLPVAGHVSIESDVRLVAGTEKDLEAEVAAGRFREDLYFKLAVIPMDVPPLRERREDVPLLVEHYLERYAREYGRPRRKAEPETMHLLAAYAWPGNVRELRNIVERLAILAPGESIAVADLPDRLVAGGGDAGVSFEASAESSLQTARREFERRLIAERLEEAGGNITRAAESLGIERSNLYRKMRAYGIRPRGERD